ncbi:MAG TPA: phage Gp37/Gp68 family protein [Thermodesulfobacteriota bacterium]
MGTNSKIEWTQVTWNPVTGCSKVSQGCKHCYAERLAMRLQKMGVQRYQNGFSVTLHEDAVALPIKWKYPSIIFVNSMSDLFHENIPFEFITQVFGTMERCPQHIFQILTKRSNRLRDLASKLPWPTNVWMGVSVEDKEVLDRIYDLQKVRAHIRFLSCEPLIGALDTIPLVGINWVIVGGESGPKARPMKKEWVLSILQQCREADVPFFFKQWGGVRKDLTGRKLNGRTYDEIPLDRYDYKPQLALF